MLGQPKGYIGIKHEITHSRKPGKGPLGQDLTEEYFKALQGKTVPVIDIAVDGSSYLVLGQGESGGFLWDIDKEDTSQVLIPYNFFHPGATIEDLIETLRIMERGGKTPCQNFMIQPAIDAALKKANEDMMAQDRASGVKDPQPMYTLGRNVCVECRGKPIMEGAGHRVCFKESEK